MKYSLIDFDDTKNLPIPEIPFMRKEDEVTTQQTKRDPDDEITQRTAAMKLAMNDPDNLREYYEPPLY